MKNLWRNSLLLFCALRASDLINLVGGLYFVPRFVSPTDLGAILPVTSFATFLAIPRFDFDAFAAAIVKTLDESAEYTRLRELGAACAAQYDWNAVAAADSAAV